MTTLHLAQINIGRIREPLEHARMQGFVSRLADLNALADRSPGFVWRLQTTEGDATYFRPYNDDRILVNLSVWESIETLRAYVYGTAHAELLKQRREWFEHFSTAYLALWWVRAGHRPDVEEGKARLAHLDAHGPTNVAFTFKSIHQPENEELRMRNELRIQNSTS